MHQNSPLFVAYCPDGSYERAGGVRRTPNRDRLLAALPDLAAAGFHDVATISYPGVYRDARTAADYFAPLNEAAAALNVRLIPGLWLHNIIEMLYGGDARGRHAEKPRALKTSALREQLLEAADLLMQATPRAAAVYIDGEHCFWDTRGSVWWNSAANMGGVADTFDRLATWCAARQSVALLYHPDPAGVAAIRRIAAGTLGGLRHRPDAAAALRVLTPQPYFATASYRLLTPAQIEQRIVAANIPLRATRLGFISNHAAGGFTPQTFRAYLGQHALSAARTWYVCNHLKLATIARQFAALAAQDAEVPA